MLDNPLSAVILEWTLSDVMFCVILFGVCSPSLFLFSCDIPLCHVLDGDNSADPPIKHLFTVPAVVSVQVGERGGAREEREEQRRQNGGLHEEAAPKQHRKPERTPR